MNTFKTPQEAFWAGEFGDEYVERNTEDRWLSANLSLFSKILEHTNSIHSVIEFGANIGLNLKALKHLLPSANLKGIEINSKAATRLSALIGEENVIHGSIFDFKQEGVADLAMIKGVLIHINPEELQNVYESLYTASKKYILVAEYYNPAPVEINYRGHEGRLFKRDFAGEILDKYPSLKLIDYGFVYHRDSHFPQDDVTWFLMSK